MDGNRISIDWSISDWERFQVKGLGLRALLFFEKVITMRYFSKKPEHYSVIYGKTYSCDHPVYDKCTLFTINNKGLAVIQQRYSQSNKYTYWTEIDQWLIDDLYLHERFEQFFNERAGECVDGLYPTVTIRQIMWGLKMKPLPRERWETCFDRRLI